MRRIWQRDGGGILGLLLLAPFILGAVLAPMLPIPAPTAPDLMARLAAPGTGAHWLGTDQLGRDILSRIIYGAQVTLTIGALSVLLGGVVGVGVGILSGYLRGWFDRIMMRIVDIQLAMPVMLLALLVVAVLGASLRNVVLVLALTGWVRFARIVRGEAMTLREREFMLAVRAAGAGPLRATLRHILPNLASSVLVVATLELARIVLMEAALSFLGLGVQPPFPSWGRMLSDGRDYMDSAWWIAAFPGLAIMLVVLGANLIGDWLRDRFDPRSVTRQ